MSLAQLDTIGLAELVAQAALLERIDRKYVVPRNALPALTDAAPAGTRIVLRHGERLSRGRRVHDSGASAQWLQPSHERFYHR